jgi:hypothetical protein
MPSRNVLRNFNLSTSVDGNKFPGGYIWFWGDVNSYDSGSGLWLDKSGNENHATVSGSALMQTGSLGLVFNGTNNSLVWENGPFLTSSCVDDSFTIQITMQPDFSVTTSPYNTTALFDRNESIVGGTGSMNLYYNDGLDAGGTPTQGSSFNPANNNRDTYIYGVNKTDAGFFSSSVQTITWKFTPAIPDSSELPYEYQYYISGFGEQQYTNAGNIEFINGETPTKTFGLPIYTSTGTIGGGQDLTYNRYKGIVRDILIYRKGLTEYEISRNAKLLNIYNNI